MNLDSQLIERLVRETLAALTAAQGPPVPPPPAAKPVVIPFPAQSAAEKITDSGLREWKEKLFTAADVETLPKGVVRLRVPHKGVVTPAARDALRKKKIELIREQPVGLGRSVGAMAAASVKPVVEVKRANVVWAEAELRGDAAALLSAAEREFGLFQRLPKAGLAAAVAETTDEVARGGKLGVILTSQSVSAVCQANRRTGVRAFEPSSAPALQRALQEIGVNLLVLNPSDHSFFAAKRLISEFVKATKRIAPAFDR